MALTRLSCLRSHVKKVFHYCFINFQQFPNLFFMRSRQQSSSCSVGTKRCGNEKAVRERTIVQEGDRGVAGSQMRCLHKWGEMKVEQQKEELRKEGCSGVSSPSLPSPVICRSRKLLLALISYLQGAYGRLAEPGRLLMALAFCQTERPFCVFWFPSSCWFSG